MPDDNNNLQQKKSNALDRLLDELTKDFIYTSCLFLQPDKGVDKACTIDDLILYIYPNLYQLINKTPLPEQSVESELETVEYSIVKAECSSSAKLEVLLSLAKKLHQLEKQIGSCSKKNIDIEVFWKDSTSKNETLDYDGAIYYRFSEYVVLNLRMCREKYAENYTTFEEFKNAFTIKRNQKKGSLAYNIYHRLCVLKNYRLSGDYDIGKGELRRKQLDAVREELLQDNSTLSNGNS